MGDEDMFDNTEEDKDFASQIYKDSSDATRGDGDREGTPGPQTNHHADDVEDVSRAQGSTATSGATATGSTSTSNKKPPPS